MTSASLARSNLRSPAILVVTWLILQIGGLFTPGLLDDVDSVYLEVAREMLHRHDYVTPVIDGIRFFDKPPLMYWMAAGSMRLLGEHDWAARLPLALADLALLLAVYALGRRFYGERGGLYAALALATAVGPYLYTRFYIPDLVIALWMTLAVHLFLIALDRAHARQSTVAPSLGFAVVLALSLLTKGVIGLVFPLGFIAIYLLLSRQLPMLSRLRPGWSLPTFTAVALPWHLLAALRNPPIAMPLGVGLPAHAGWAWFYLYNEHVARFLGRRIPHDYGQTPIWLFWTYALLWMLPWAAFLPVALSKMRKALGHREPVTTREREAALSVALWAGIVMIFFTLSSRQEYYSLPALPALALLIGGTLGHAGNPLRGIALCHRWLLLPCTILLAMLCAALAVWAPRPMPGADLSTLLNANPEMYNLSLGHLFDLTGPAMGLFRGPLTAVAVGMLIAGPVSYLTRHRGRSHAANLILAAGATIVLLAAHEGMVRFYPILGSKALAEAVLREQATHPVLQPDIIAIDGELTSASSVLFYCRQPVHLVNGRVNGPWFGSLWPDAPALFEDEASLRQLWQGPRRVFLVTGNPAARLKDLPRAFVLASAGGKSVLVSDQPLATGSR